LLEKLLQIDPDQRCSAAEGLESQYLAPYHDPNDEPESTETFDWSFSEASLPADVWKTVMYAEVLGYHESVGGSTQLTPQLDGMDLKQ
jgi:p38 MAP kinase